MFDIHILGIFACISICVLFMISVIRLRSKAFVDVSRKTREMKKLLLKHFDDSKTSSIIEQCLNKTGISGKNRITITGLVELHGELEAVLAQSLDGTAARNAMQNGIKYSRRESKAIMMMYTEILADLKVTPYDLSRKIDYYRGIKKLLIRYSGELENKIRERDEQIIERKRVEQALKESEESYKRMIEAITTYTYSVEVGDGKPVSTSHSAGCVSVTGFTLEDYNSNQYLWHSMIHAEDREMVESSINRLLGGSNISPIEHRIIRRDGKTIWVRNTMVPHFNAEGAFIRYDGLIEDITERKNAELELKKSYEKMEERVRERTKELQNANEEIKRFAYIVSHDLRAPLINLMGYSKELKSALNIVNDAAAGYAKHLDPEKQKKVKSALDEDIPEALDFINISVKRMDNLVNAVLKLSRIGRRELHLEKLDMNELINNLMKSISHQFEEKNVKVTVLPLPEITADRISMEQIFGNILDNAVKYLSSDRKGEIKIDGKKIKDYTIFSIQDNGRGISKEDLTKVFEPFQRVGVLDVQGEGMGLAYVQTLVRRHGGSIWCESEPGVGTSFIFSISDNISGDKTDD